VDNSFWIFAVPSDRTRQVSPVPAGLEFYYAPPEKITPVDALLEGEEYAHLTHVMRHKTGDTIGIVDGAGMAHVCTITAIERRSARCEIVSSHPEFHESERQVTLAVGLLKNPSRFEVIVEKATEIGVRTIIPLLTARTIAHHAKTTRWHTIALAAMKQCGRCRLPVIAPPTPLTEVLKRSAGLTLLLHEQASARMEDSLTATSNDAISACIGPEGGFTDEEVALAQQMGWQVVLVGTRRLRSETAAIAAAVRLLL
jgi:16S rRNA (uracil1498-N3)-methyltransferase